ncbi:hypothetical protein [Gaopeijia maritima]|uniref:hypothetical protein n=1 Tax=Gaopeijia maritima TaxID=3119007 RepID=UPI0038679D86
MRLGVIGRVGWGDERKGWRSEDWQDFFPVRIRLLAQFNDSARYRTSSPECAAIADDFQALLSAGQVYWASPDEALGSSWHVTTGGTTVGIALDGMNFFDFDGADPYANLRLKTATHEAGHEYGLPDEPSIGEPVTADDAANYCTRQTNINPWGVGGSGGGGDDSNMACWTLQRDYYYYYPDTDVWEYQYTDTYSWCEEVV